MDQKGEATTHHWMMTRTIWPSSMVFWHALIRLQSILGITWFDPARPKVLMEKPILCVNVFSSFCLIVSQAEQKKRHLCLKGELWGLTVPCQTTHVLNSKPFTSSEVSDSGKHDVSLNNGGRIAIRVVSTRTFWETLNSELLTSSFPCQPFKHLCVKNSRKVAN